MASPGTSPIQHPYISALSIRQPTPYYPRISSYQPVTLTPVVYYGRVIFPFSSVGRPRDNFPRVQAPFFYTNLHSGPVYLAPNSTLSPITPLNNPRVINYPPTLVRRDQSTASQDNSSSPSGSSISHDSTKSFTPPASHPETPIEFNLSLGSSSLSPLLGSPILHAHNSSNTSRVLDFEKE